MQRGAVLGLAFMPGSHSVSVVLTSAVGWNLPIKLAISLLIMCAKSEYNFIHVTSNRPGLSGLSHVILLI